MKRAMLALVLLMLHGSGLAASHGPVFGMATPTNSQGEWSFDNGVFGRAGEAGTQTSFRTLIGYGFTPHLTFSFTAPVVAGSASLPPTRIQPGDDFDATLAWRFQHRATKVGTRIESTAFGGLIVPGPQSTLRSVAQTSNAPGFTVGAVTGLASLSHYLWLGASFGRFAEHSGDRRPNVLDYSLVYGFRPKNWRRSPDKWDWRLFAEVVGERSDRFLQEGLVVGGTQASQVFLGPSALGIFRNYTVSFGVQFPVYQDLGTAWPKEHARYAVNFSYLLFQHAH